MHVLQHFRLLPLLLISFIHAQDVFNPHVTQLLQATYDNKPAFVLYVPTRGAIEHNESNAWQSFNTCAFVLPRMLEEAKAQKASVVLLVPEYYMASETIGPDAPWLEGARVAMSWASAYFRFKELGEVDIRIILLPERTLSFIDLKYAVSRVLNKKIQDKNTPEASINNRIFTFENVIASSVGDPKITFDTYCATIVEEQRTVIKPSLPSYKSPAQRILITGGAGFLGSHIAHELINQGHQVIVLDNLTCGNSENIKDLQSNKCFAFYNVDVSKPFDVEGAIDVVMHLASIPSPLQYYAKPVETLTSGLYGAKYTIELAIKKNAKYLFSSTSEVYGDPEVSPQPEEYIGRVSPVGKRSQYDQSKRGTETLIKLYFEKYHFDARLVRIFNTYGPAMSIGDGRVITNFIGAIINNEPMVINGSGKQTRSFAYVTDTMSGILQLLNNNDIASYQTISERIFNVGNPSEFTINELAEKVSDLSVKYFNRPGIIIHQPNPDPDDPRIRKPNCNRISQLTGYAPRVTLDEGLEKILLSYLKK